MRNLRVGDGSMRPTTLLRRFVTLCTCAWWQKASIFGVSRHVRREKICSAQEYLRIPIYMPRVKNCQLFVNLRSSNHFYTPILKMKLNHILASAEVVKNA